MGIGKRIKEAREKLGLTQSELADKIGVTGSAITNYEKGTSHPKEPIMYKLIDALDVDANYLFQDVVNTASKIKDVTLAEHELISKIRALDDYGRETIEMLLDRELKRVHELKTTREEIYGELPFDIPEKGTPTKIVAFFPKIASAGSGDYLFDYIPTDTIEVPLDHISKDADFVVGVNGDSMEPHYHDGDKVLVKKTTEKLQKDKVGIFMIGNDVLIKRVGDEGLLSDNKNYPGIPYTGTQDIKCIGEVVGKTAVPGSERNLSDTDLQALSFKAKMFNENPKISSFPIGNR